jgi:hypothetical protein
VHDSQRPEILHSNTRKVDRICIAQLWCTQDICRSPDELYESFTDFGESQFLTARNACSVHEVAVCSESEAPATDEIEFMTWSWHDVRPMWVIIVRFVACPS